MRSTNRRARRPAPSWQCPTCGGFRPRVRGRRQRSPGGLRVYYPVRIVWRDRRLGSGVRTANNMTGGGRRPVPDCPDLWHQRHQPLDPAPAPLPERHHDPLRSKVKAVEHKGRQAKVRR